jgi:hypothetical protein
MRALEDGTFEMHAPEIIGSTFKVRVHEEGLVETREIESGPLQARGPKVGHFETREDEVGTLEMRIVEDRPFEMRVSEGGSFQNCTTKIETPGVGALAFAALLTSPLDHRHGAISISPTMPSM